MTENPVDRAFDRGILPAFGCLSVIFLGCIHTLMWLFTYGLLFTVAGAFAFMVFAPLFFLVFLVAVVHWFITLRMRFRDPEISGTISEFFKDTK